MMGYGKLYGQNIDQYIDAKWKNLNMVRLRVCSFLDGNTSIKIYAEDNLIVLNRNVVCRITIGDNLSVNLGVSFENIIRYIMNTVKIVKVLDDLAMDRYNNVTGEIISFLKNRINRTTNDLDSVNDFVQISRLINDSDKYVNNNALLLQWIANNPIVSRHLNDRSKYCLDVENKIKSECNLFPMLLAPRSETIKLYTGISELYNAAVAHHKTAIINICADNSKLPIANDLDRIEPYQVFYIHMEDIKMFTAVETFLTTKNDSFWMDFLLTSWEKFISSVRQIKHFETLANLPPLTYKHYLPLLKSFVDLTMEIVDETKMPIEQLIVRNRNKCWKLTDKIRWPSESQFQKSTDIQYRFTYDQLCKVEPGKCKPNFNYTYFFNFLSANQAELKMCHEYQKVWLVILDFTLSKMMYGVPTSSKKPYSDLCISLLKCFLKFIKQKKDRYEALRMAVHNIIKFVAQISPYMSKINLKSTIDQVILDKQIEYITYTMTAQGDNELSNYFTNIIDVYGHYWINRDKVIGKLPTIYPCKTFSTDTDQIYQLILTIAKDVFGAVISNKISFETLITFMRSFNEFVEDLDEIEFKWYVKYNPLFNTAYLDIVDNKLATEEKRTYLVTEVSKFADELKTSNIARPTNYLTKTIIHLLIIINDSLRKENWPNNTEIPYAERILISSSLLSAIRSSFLYLKEQPLYRDFDVFLEESTKPFYNILAESESRKNFNERIVIIKESYWYIRKQDEIGIEEALRLFASLNSSNVNKYELNKAYSCYLDAFNTNIDSFYRDKNLSNIITDVIKMSTEIKNNHGWKVEQWTHKFKLAVIPKLLAGLSAVWSIKQSKDISLKKCLKPHCIQILCIFRLLGVDALESKIGVEKHLAQVLTGQGEFFFLRMFFSWYFIIIFQLKLIYFVHQLITDNSTFFCLTYW